jgi:ubiquinone/menaquinone biosynthesis C-methylase UbiE
MESINDIYVCPECKQPLDDYFCRHCSVRYPVRDGIPCFILDPPSPERLDVRQVYDEIYSNHQDAWVDQGRSEEFIAYFCELAKSRRPDRILEIGCGEGELLAAMSATRKFGVDPSINALQRARSRSNAECSVARSEQLPFPSESFDLVITVGVMEHFEDPDAATREIRRVLSRPGHYIALIQTDLGTRQRMLLKFRQFVFPKFRPIQFAKWVRKKLHNPIVQPFRRSHTIESARQCIERSGLKVTEIITRATHRAAPLTGPHVVIFVACK